jgi:transporter family protein
MAWLPVWLPWALLSAFFAGLTALFGKIGVEAINSNLATLIRTAVILVLVAALVALNRDWQPLAAVPRRTWIFLLLSGAATGASWACYYHALKLGPASGVAPVDKLSVVFVAVLAVAFLGEHLPPAGWLGVGLMGAGAALLVLT